MSSNVKDVLQAPILRYDSLDSTNNYAAQLANAETAQEGLTVVALTQTAGKGQRANQWHAQPGQSLLMSILLHPRLSLEHQFSFSAAIAVAVVGALQSFDEKMQIAIKFPNDIIVNDKKAAGILIENSLKGNDWTHAIVGVGINVLQRSFSNLPNATSLFLSTGKEHAIQDLLVSVRTNIIRFACEAHRPENLYLYNELLYKRNKIQKFSSDNHIFEAKIMGVNEDGQLVLLLKEGVTKAFSHGELQWIW